MSPKCEVVGCRETAMVVVQGKLFCPTHALVKAKEMAK